MSKSDALFFRAVLMGDLPVIEEMFRESDLGVKGLLSLRNANGDTPLIVAAYYGHLKVVEALLKRGHTLESFNSDTLVSVNSDGDQALILAASNGHLDVVKELLRNYGPKLSDAGYIGSANNYGFTARSLAEKNGHSKIVEAIDELPFNYKPLYPGAASEVVRDLRTEGGRYHG